MFSGEGRYLLLSAHGRDLVLNFLPEPCQEGVPSHHLPLSIGDEPGLLNFQFDPAGCFPSAVPGGIPDQPPDLRSAVLAFLCRELLDLIGSRMNLPVGVSNADETAFPVSLHFRIDSADDSPPEVWGTLCLGPKAAGALLSSAVGWPRDVGPLAGSVAVECPVVIASVPVSAVDFQDLSPGDLILLGTPGSLSPLILPPGGGRIPCRVPSLENVGDS